MTGAWTHEFAFPIPADPHRIFEALTSDDELQGWFAESASVEPREGGAYRFWGRHTVGTPSESEATGTIHAFEPGRRLAFGWTVCGTPSTVEFSLSEVDAEEEGVGGAVPEKGIATKVAIRHELEGPLDRPRPKALIDDWWRFTLGNLMSHVTGHGEVLRPDFADPEPEIRLSMTVDAPPEAVFRALTEPEALTEWMGAPDPEIELRVGGRYSLGWTYTVDGREVEGGPMKILDVVPDERLVVDWPDWRGDPSVPRQSIAWHLEPEGEGTRVTLVHAGFVRTVDFSDYPFGWGHFMSEMAKVAIRLAA